jgi:hypothetical protein
MMSGPFIFIATNQLREGKLDAERGRAIELSSFIEASEPQLLAFNEYVNDEGTEVGVVQVHPDAASMEHHIDLVAERAASAYAETLEATTRIQVYGVPSCARSPRKPVSCSRPGTPARSPAVSTARRSTQ